MEGGARGDGAGGEIQAKFNKYAAACAIVASMISIIFGYEVSSPSSRGFLTSLPELGISIGILLGYISNVIFGKLTLKLGWRLMLGVAAIPSVILGLWHRTNARVSKVKTHGEGAWKELLLRPTPAVRWILIAAIGIHFFEHAVGIEAVVLYSPRIFKKAGVTGKEKLLLATVGVGLTKFVFVFIATFLIDRVGRRRLLLTSTAGIVASLTVLASCLTIVEYHTGRKLLWALSLSIIATYVFVAFFNIGLAPVTWVYSSEIFPLKLRAQGYSIGVAVNRLMNATISMSFISLYKAITIGGAFFMFAGVSVIAWFFFYFLFPETKGRSLEELELLFSNGIMARNETMELQPRATSNNV
ncbi:hypothetical protein GH714_033984 [Hevea brasiliensis]|uniref:Major facilitator superfamily (MFS) profile domain-containing protein n=1 Tax=Hevea brasiliensis TaxID=3981 RepID=A0A6A6LMK9_HEVBR|nr:hypothetical protein GH714_033984 [Hevea brasiliensis]